MQIWVNRFIVLNDELVRRSLGIYRINCEKYWIKVKIISQKFQFSTLNVEKIKSNFSKQFFSFCENQRIHGYFHAIKKKN